MQDINYVFSKNLRSKRRELGLTQRQLAEKLGYTEKAVSKWESGNALPPSSVLIALADAVHASIDELLDVKLEPEYFLGIDGGGTKTDFALTDKDENVIRRVKLEACNPIDIGLDAAKGVLERGIRQICKDIPLRKVAVWAGIAGGGTQEMRAPLHEFLASFNFSRFDNNNDAVLVAYSALGKDDGISVIMGTGSILYLKRGDSLSPMGGLGYLFDKGGNGYSLGRDALLAAMNYEDGAGPYTKLCPLLCKMMDKKTVKQSLATYYTLGKRGIAAFAPLVFEAAQDGDAVANNILFENMGEIAGLLAKAREKFKDTEKVKVVFVGGLTQRRDVLFPMIKEQLPCADEFEFSVFEDAPAIGAARLAKGL